MSAFNGDKARFHRERKGKLARRERSRLLRKKAEPAVPVITVIPAPPTGAQL
jgi:hypothetical protein